MGGYEKIQDLFDRSSVKFDIMGSRADSLEEAHVVIQDLATVKRKQFDNAPPNMRPADPVNLNEKYQIDCFNSLHCGPELAKMTKINYGFYLSDLDM